MRKWAIIKKKIRCPIKIKVKSMCFSLNLDLGFINMKKIIIGFTSGVIILQVSLLASFVIHLIQPSIQLEYENEAIFRSWSDPLMSYFYIEPFFLGFVLIWIWDKTKALLKGRDTLQKGLRFGLIYWVITLPGMMMTYSSFKVSLMMVMSWSLSTLISSIISGFIFSKTIK